MTGDALRLRFPALEHAAWLGTPAAAPGAAPAADAATDAPDAQRTGQRRWPAWGEETRKECRSLIAAYPGVPGRRAAITGPVAEIAATMAAWLSPGCAVAGAGEYHTTRNWPVRSARTAGQAGPRERGAATSETAARRSCACCESSCERAASWAGPGELAPSPGVAHYAASRTRHWLGFG